jgi:hypothetical protein
VRARPSFPRNRHDTGLREAAFPARPRSHPAARRTPPCCGVRAAPAGHEELARFLAPARIAPAESAEALGPCHHRVFALLRLYPTDTGAVRPPGVNLYSFPDPVTLHETRSSMHAGGRSFTRNPGKQEKKKLQHCDRSYWLL